MNGNFQPAGMLGDQGDSDLEYMDFGDNVVPQKPCTVHDFPQYVPKHTGGFGLPEKKTNGNTKDYSDGSRVSKARQRKKRGNSLPTDAMAIDNFRVACSRGNLEEVKAHLVNGFDANTIVKSDWTGLMYACDGGHEAIVKLLLSYGANPNYIKDQVTPLMVCCSSNSANERSLVNILKQLLSAGANLTVHDRHHMSPLLLASYKGKCTLVTELLATGADVNKQDSRGWSSLHYAAEVGNVKLVRILLEAGIDTKLMSFTGETAADIAYAKDFNNVGDAIIGTSLGKKRSSLLETCDNSTTGEGAMIVRNSSSASVGSHDSSSPLIHYGDLELFLISIQLGSLVSLFQAKKVTFSDLLVVSDEELQKIGVKDINARQRILGGVLHVHKKEWKMSSHASLPHNRSLRFVEVALIANNLSKHLSYVATTAEYLRGQLNQNPSIMEQPSQDESDIHLDVLTAMTSLAKLKEHIENIKTHTLPLAKQKEDEKSKSVTVGGWQKYRIPMVMVMATSAGLALIGVAAFQYWTGKPWSTIHQYIMHQ